MIRLRTLLKTYFQRKDRPKEANFADLIDSFFHLTENTTDDLTEGAVNKFITAEDRENLDNLGEFADPPSTFDDLTDGTTNKAYTVTEKSKLSAMKEYPNLNRTKILSLTGNVTLTTGTDGCFVLVTGTTDLWTINLANGSVGSFYIIKHDVPGVSVAGTGLSTGQLPEGYMAVYAWTGAGWETINIGKITEYGLTLTDIATGNASASKHGFLPKLPGNTTTFLRGDGSWSNTSAFAPALGADDNYVTDAEKTKLANLSGTNSGDETATTIGTKIDGSTAKTTPVDADNISITDSAASHILKKVTWSNIKATLKTYFDTLYSLSGHNHSGTYAPTGSATTSGLTMATARLLGRTTASAGAIEELSTADSFVSTASTSTAGKISIATSAETTTGSEPSKALSPDGFAGSDYGKRVVGLMINDSTALTTGDGKAFFRVPSVMNGWNLVAVAANCQTASSSGVPTIQIRNVTDSVDMLSTRITIDQSETDSSTAATAAVIDTTKDDVATGDKIAIDVDVAGTGTAWLFIELTFQAP